MSVRSGLRDVALIVECGVFFLLAGVLRIGERGNGRVAVAMDRWAGGLNQKIERRGAS